MNNQQTISNNLMEEQVVEDQSYEQEEDEDLEQYTQQQNLKQLLKNSDSFMQQINQLNEQSIVKIKQQKYKEALKLLQQSEQMLEFAASCGKVIDRNLIIIILYNQACTYQCQWVLDKCSKYLDSVIYNMELAIKEDEQDLENFVSVQEKQAQLVKRQTFLAKAYLQYTAILSQMGKHNKALINSQKAASIMRELFKIANQFCQQWLQSNGSSGTATTSQSNISIRSNQQEQQQLDQHKQKRGQKYRMKDEIEFSRLVIDGAQDILKDMIKQVDLEKIPVNEKQLLKEAKKQLYYWRNNPENNEKHLRKELKLVSQNEEYRSLLGIQNIAEWIKNFNIGSIMHMAPQIYDDFTQFGEMIYELAKRQILEKVIYFSISYFTIATELRFIELEKAKQMGLKEDKIDTEEFKLSELYHLKSIEIACRHITTQSPYISHLITSYHKHYNINLDIIKEESILSNISEKQSIVNQESIQTQKQNQILQIQINNDNKNIIKQDQSPKLTNNFITKFLNSRSPPKTQQQSKIKNIIKNQADLIEQMINQKRGSDYSPSNQQNNHINQGQLDFSMYLKKYSNPCNTSNSNINSTQDFINSTMTIQLQPHKNNPNFRSNPIQQQSPTNNSGQLKSLLSDVCRTERQNGIDKQNSHTPISYRVNNRSPDSSYINSQKLKQQQLHLNKTPQNRPRTNTEQQQPCFPFKFETIQLLLKNKGNISKQK
ncbi:unnamed protein product [Paramecium primaurelia]|uniref:Uncharacterized protein n=1 Tax=Paramecium primaurelia TaxID=5886 RepID=A0A8S1NDA5_PARPR|nr:unnamed protein product [Paramecium primaurelia]